MAQTNRVMSHPTTSQEFSDWTPDWRTTYVNAMPIQQVEPGRLIINHNTIQHSQMNQNQFQFNQHEGTTHDMQEEVGSILVTSDDNSRISHSSESVVSIPASRDEIRISRSARMQRLTPYNRETGVSRAAGNAVPYTMNTGQSTRPDDLSFSNLTHNSRSIPLVFPTINPIHVASNRNWNPTQSTSREPTYPNFSAELNVPPDLTMSDAGRPTHVAGRSYHQARSSSYTNSSSIPFTTTMGQQQERVTQTFPAMQNPNTRQTKFTSLHRNPRMMNYVTPQPNGMTAGGSMTTAIPSSVLSMPYSYTTHQETFRSPVNEPTLPRSSAVSSETILNANSWSNQNLSGSSICLPLNHDMASSGNKYEAKRIPLPAGVNDVARRGPEFCAALQLGTR